tara:strand:+ start:356 stop:1156 length:801 start_codon:yes stop_codon:yes gene_type:complete
MKSNQRHEIIYITLKDNERSLIYSDYLKSINLDAKHFYGFDLRKVSDLNEFQNFSQKKFFNRYGRNPTKSEIGCSLSHYKVIKLSKISDSLIILEDDALLKVSSKKFLEIIDLIKNIDKYEIVIFGFSKCDDISDFQLNISNPFLTTKTFKNLDYSLGERLINSTSGALAYYLSPSAKKKISFLKEIYHVADDWKFYSDLGIKIGYIYPTLVIEDLNQKSTLNHNENYFRANSSKNIFINSLLIVKNYSLGFIRRLILKFKIIFFD